jgi:hypothetical protein
MAKKGFGGARGAAKSEREFMKRVEKAQKLARRREAREAKPEPGGAKAGQGAPRPADTRQR